MIEVGSTIQNYRVVRELGSGAMGAVYEAVDTLIERPVAIKMLRAEIARQPELIERFRTEAITLAKLNHPNIALLYNFFRQGEDYFMVMEYVQGQTLESIIRGSSRLDPDTAARIMRQTLDGLGHAHSMGVLHRDVKPANVMVTSEGRAKVTDFGIARVLGSSRQTRTGRIIGTLEYIAPERIRGDESDPRSDLYSAGVVLFEMLTGRLPFTADTDFALIKAHTEEQPPRLAEVIGQELPGDWEELVQRAMSKSPDERFQSAEEFRDAIPEPAAPSTRSAAVRSTRPVTASTPAAATRQGTTPVAVAKKKSDAPLALIIGTVALILIICAAAVFIRHRRDVADREKALQPNETPHVNLGPQGPAQNQQAEPPGNESTPPPASATTPVEVRNDTAEKSARPPAKASDKAADKKRKDALRALEEGTTPAKDKKAEALRALQ